MNLIKSLLSKFKKNTFDLFKYITIGSATLYINDHIGLVHRAARICVGKEPFDETESKLQHIKTVIARGHESVLEHSNIIMYLSIPKKHTDALLELTSCFKYLNYKIIIEKEYIKLLIGGSIRGYKHIFRSILNQNNVILEYIKQELYVSTNAEYYEDFIDAGIMSLKYFKYEPDSQLVFDEITQEMVCVETDEVDPWDEYGDHDTFKILDIDEIGYVYDSFVKDLGFTLDDLLDMCVISVHFKHCSRAITQQLVRHRVAISQESQRYVDYSDMKFVDPTQFKPNKYDMDTRYDIVIGGRTHQVTTEELANSLLMPIYPQLRAQGLDKEDARGFSLFNLESQLIMTFTLRGFIKFLELREEKSAQAEIKKTAAEMKIEFDSKLEPIIGEIYKYLLPKYTLYQADCNYDDIDEPMGDIEDVLEGVDQETKDVLDSIDKAADSLDEERDSLQNQIRRFDEGHKK